VRAGLCSTSGSAVGVGCPVYIMLFMSPTFTIGASLLMACLLRVTSKAGCHVSRPTPAFAVEQTASKAEALPCCLTVCGALYNGCNAPNVHAPASICAGCKAFDSGLTPGRASVGPTIVLQHRARPGPGVLATPVTQC
jgi:hypothetical protein